MRKSNNITNDPLLMAKIPPQAIDLEEAVLGALMIEKKAFMDVCEILEPDSFYHDGNREIYTAIVELNKQNKPVDILTITNYLRHTGRIEHAGGAYYVTQLTNRVSSTANIVYHATIIAEKAMLRDAIMVSGTILKQSYNETADPLELISTALMQFEAIQNKRNTSKEVHISKAMTATIKTIEIASQSEDGLTGIPSGFTSLDRKTNGFQKTDLIILAARPGMGKTSLALQMLRNAAVDYGIRGAIFSLEMSTVQLCKKLASMETDIDLFKINHGKYLTDDDFLKLVEMDALYDSNLWIDDTGGLDILDLKARIRRMVAVNKVEFVIIDYLQLVHYFQKGQSKEQEISFISRSLKELAKELNIPIIVLSQLSRECEKRGDKRPILSDLRDSGAIEQDADMVMFIYRDEYYNDDTVKVETEIGALPMVELDIAKFRNGNPDMVELGWMGLMTKFYEVKQAAF